MDIKEIKNSLLNTIKVIEDTIKEAEMRYSEILNKTSEAEANYVEALESVSSAKKEASNIIVSLNKLRNELEERERDVCAKEKAIDIRIDETNKSIESISARKSKIEKEISEIKHTESTLSDLQKRTVSATEILKKTVDEIKTKESELVSLTMKSEKIVDNAEMLVAEAQKKADSIVKNATEKHEDILSRAAYLYDLEKKLVTKEADLNIVEARLRKLYDDKGLGFKI